MNLRAATYLVREAEYALRALIAEDLDAGVVQALVFVVKARNELEVVKQKEEAKRDE